MLVLRCPTHPDYEGIQIPGQLGIIDRPHGSGGCGDCWELFRQKQAEAGNAEARLGSWMPGPNQSEGSR